MLYKCNIVRMYIWNPHCNTLLLHKTRLKMSDEKHKRTVIHVEIDGQHLYFGSLRAIYTKLNSADIGITYSSLRNVGLTHQKPYQNKQCIIRKGVLCTISPKNATKRHDTQ